MTLRAVMTACAIGTLAACGAFSHAQTAPPPSAGFPMYWNPTGPHDPAINFSGLPIQRDKSYMFYEHLIGKYPRIRTDPRNGRVYVENEGIPQKANMATHLAKVRSDVIRALPDPNWNGMAILDFEAWSPSWAWLNNTRMKNMSREWVQSRFPGLSPAQVEQRAGEEFHSAAMNFMIATIRECKAVRPHAVWGYYGYPYNFTPADQQAMAPLFNEMDAFFPDIYPVEYGIATGETPRAWQRAVTNYENGVTWKINLAKSLAGSRPVYSILVMRYTECNPEYMGQFMGTLDLQAMFRNSARAGAKGAIIWDAFSEASVRDGYNSFFAGRGGTVIRSLLHEISPAPTPPPSAGPPPITSNTGIRTAAPPVNKAAKAAPVVRITAAAPAPARR